MHNDADHNTAKNIEITYNFVETDYGDRKVSNQNFSKIIVLPKGALANCGNPVRVNVRLVYDNDIRYIKLTPVQYADLLEI